MFILKLVMFILKPVMFILKPVTFVLYLLSERENLEYSFVNHPQNLKGTLV